MQNYIYTTLGIEKFEEIMEGCPLVNRTTYAGLPTFRSEDNEVQFLWMNGVESTNPFHKEFYPHEEYTLIDFVAPSGEKQKEVLQYLIPKLENPKMADCFKGSEISLDDFIE